MLSRSLLPAIACALAAGAGGRVAIAEPSADDAAAEALFDEAVALRNAGDRAAACGKFRRSYKLSPARGTLLNIAECFETEGKLASAWATYRKLADASETAGDRERLLIARAKRAELEPRLAYLTIVAASARADLVVRRDDSTLSGDVLDEPAPIDAGVHRITVSAPGYEPWTTDVEIADGERQRITVPALVAQRPVASPSLQPIARRAHTSGRHPRATAGLAVAGAGGVSVVIGLGFGVAAWSAERDAACGSGGCSTQGYDRLEDAHAHARNANLFVGLGAAIAAVGAVMWWTAPDGNELTVAPLGGPGTVGISFAGSFGERP
ncbi:MAG TPA: PEGA domain-containing protein [Kofleriaceae bacterium]|nr:PEGA domain-containing protein [Kofleriaceae bacterium]